MVQEAQIRCSVTTLGGGMVGGESEVPEGGDMGIPMADSY